MKGTFFAEHGERDVLQVGDLPTPEPGPGEVRVRTRAVALNHLDVWVRRGWKGLDLEFPHTGGADAAGVVDVLGPDVEEIAVGDEVVLSPGWHCGHCPKCLTGRENHCPEYHLIGEHRNGAAAEYFVVPARNLLPKPPGLSWTDAASIGVTFITAWHMLVSRAKVQPGETVLIQGASSGVGVAAIQIAKLRDAQVIALTSSPEKASAALALGADEVIDYTRTDPKQRLKELRGRAGVDVVFEHTGEATWELSVKALGVGGRLVTCGATTGPLGKIDIRILFWKQLDLLGSTMGTRAELLECLEHVAAGRLRPVVDRVLPLEEIAEGHRLIEEAAHFGKIVLEV